MLRSKTQFRVTNPLRRSLPCIGILKAWETYTLGTLKLSQACP